MALAGCRCVGALRQTCDRQGGARILPDGPAAPEPNESGASGRVHVPDRDQQTWCTKKAKPMLRGPWNLSTRQISGDIASCRWEAAL